MLPTTASVMVGPTLLSVYVAEDELELTSLQTRTWTPISSSSPLIA